MLDDKVVITKQKKTKEELKTDRLAKLENKKLQLVERQKKADAEQSKIQKQIDDLKSGNGYKPYLRTKIIIGGLVMKEISIQDSKYKALFCEFLKNNPPKNHPDLFVDLVKNSQSEEHNYKSVKPPPTAV